MAKNEKILEVIYENLYRPDRIKEILAVNRYPNKKSIHIVYYIDTEGLLGSQTFHTRSFFGKDELFLIFKEDYEKNDILYKDKVFNTIYFNMYDSNPTTDVLYHDPEKNNLFVISLPSFEINISYTRKNFELIETL